MFSTHFRAFTDDESFDEFYAKLNDVVNFSYNLVEVYDQPKIVRKILRSLTKKFRPKMTVITKSKDVDSIPIDKLVRSLQSYELDLPKTNKSKSMALKSVDDVEIGGFDDEHSAKEIVYLSGIILPKISRFSNVRTSYLSIIIPEKVFKVLGKLSNLCSRELIIKSTNLNIIN